MRLDRPQRNRSTEPGPVRNADIAETFDRLADLLDIEGASPFRIRAYREAARRIRSHPHAMADLVARRESLTQIPGIGTELSAKITAIVRTGRLPLLDQISARTPLGLSDLMRVAGLGARRVRRLHEDLGIQGFEDLEQAIRQGEVRRLPGFGPRAEAQLAKRLRQLAAEPKRTSLADAQEIAAPLLAYLELPESVVRLRIAGSYRRRCATIDKLDIVIAAKGESLTEHLRRYASVDELLEPGKSSAKARLNGGLEIDLHVVPPSLFGAALWYFTGSPAHVAALLGRPAAPKMQIRNDGTFTADRRAQSTHEHAVFTSFGLPFIPAELREDAGELEAAERGQLPRLVELEDIRGDLHSHTTATDGRDSLPDMAAAARRLGYEYLGITEHSRRVKIAHGLDENRLLAQLDTIDAFNAAEPGIHVLKSIEVDILEDGRLDLPDRVLGRLDCVVGSVHYKFDLPRRKQTERILRAMDNRYFNILGHPTGRIVNRRAPYEIDLAAVMQGAAERGCFLEVNSSPRRLDLSDQACRLAKEIGVMLAVSSDAHSIAELDFLRFGLDQARRGWVERNQVINTRSLPELRRLLMRR